MKLYQVYLPDGSEKLRAEREENENVIIESDTFAGVEELLDKGLHVPNAAKPFLNNLLSGTSPQVLESVTITDNALVVEASCSHATKHRGNILRKYEHVLGYLETATAQVIRVSALKNDIPHQEIVAIIGDEEILIYDFTTKQSGLDEDSTYYISRHHPVEFIDEEA